MSLVIKNTQIWVSQQPVDFRRAVDGLCAYIKEYFEASPQEGLYIFYNRSRNRLKMLVWHYNGFLLLYKRLEKGRFPFGFSAEPGKTLIAEKQLQGLLLGIDWQAITTWEEVSFENYF
jgi:transposase